MGQPNDRQFPGKRTAATPLKGNTPVFSDTVLKQVKAAPKAPGCYIFTDKDGIVIYVGKSKLLYNRVQQYFRPHYNDEKLQYLAGQIKNISYQITNTEREALLLEYSLIKEYKPWFNIQHKPDKNGT